MKRKTLALGLVLSAFPAAAQATGQCPTTPTNWDAEDCDVGGTTICGYDSINDSISCNLGFAGSASHLYIVDNYSTAQPFEAWGDYGGTPFCCSFPGVSGPVDTIHVYGSHYNDVIAFHWDDGTPYNLHAYGGTPLNAYIDADTGDDNIRGADNNSSDYQETLNGDEGIDVIFGGGGMDIIDGGDNDDTCDGGTEPDTITGGAGNDTLTGGSGTDTIDGEGDDDTINGGPDDDQLYGGTGVDTIHGNGNNDIIFGNDDGDILYGDAGIDEIHGGLGDDTMYGGLQNDTMYGDDNNDTMWGDAGYDTLDGGPGNDQMSGGPDNDTLNGGTGDDAICGDGQTFPGGDSLDDGDTDAGQDLLWAHEAADPGVMCGNTSTRYDCSNPPLSGAGTCNLACLTSRPASCPP